jgi:hypothetical protein
MKNLIKRAHFALYILLTTVLFSGCDYGLVKENDVQKALEQAYFEGQKDALNGDIRIKRNQDSCYIWTSSPWDNGKEPIYNPSYNCD